MHFFLRTPLLTLGLLGSFTLAAQNMAPPAKPAAPRPPVQPSYFDPAAIHPEFIIGMPPQMGTKEQADDLAEVHKIHDHASPDLVKFAQADARAQNIFLFYTIFGPDFNAKNLPITAAFGNKLTRDAGIENGILKAHFQHKRPYQMDSSLPSFCGTDQSFSYPSGHTMASFLLAYTMTDIVPEKAPEIMARAEEFAQHRIVCGVHFPTDVRAGKQVALEMFGYMQSNAEFRHDLAEARAEIRKSLHLEPLTRETMQKVEVAPAK